METYEVDHLSIVRALAPECMVLLRSDGAFPLAQPGEIALFGSGARHTVKGGTGSGDVNSRHVASIEEGLEAAGFSIVTRPWLDAYDRVRDHARQDFIAGIRAEAAERGVPAIMVGMGSVMPEPEYTIPLDVDTDADPRTAVYVLARISGEGSDRAPEAGDLRLTDTEIRDILTLNERFERFLLVLNVGGVVDLSPMEGVTNILLLSQLGTSIGDVFADVLLGRTYPSGKLAATWAAWDEDDQIGDFGDPDDTHYREGVYVGYRFYDSVGKEPLFPFGFGLGYTAFDVQTRQVSLDGARVSIDVDVANTGESPGKETVQVYVSVPAGRLDQPLQALAGFAKTDEIAPGAAAQVTIDVDLTDLASYDAAARATILEAGRYLLRAGTSSRHSRPVAVVALARDATVRRLAGDLGEPGFTDWKPEAPAVLDIPAGLPVLAVDPADRTSPSPMSRPLRRASARPSPWLEGSPTTISSTPSWATTAVARSPAPLSEQPPPPSSARRARQPRGSPACPASSWPTAPPDCGWPPPMASTPRAPSLLATPACPPPSSSLWTTPDARPSASPTSPNSVSPPRSASSTPPPSPSAQRSPSPGTRRWRSGSATSSEPKWSASASTSGSRPPSTCTAPPCADATSSTSPRIHCCPGASPPPSPAASSRIRAGESPSSTWPATTRRPTVSTPTAT